MKERNKMEKKEIEKAIREYISTVVHMSLATSHENTPWITEVHFSYDDDLNIYFRSKPHRRHSEEIKKNNKVSGNIIKQHILKEDVSGIYFE